MKKSELHTSIREIIAEMVDDEEKVNEFIGGAAGVAASVGARAGAARIMGRTYGADGTERLSQAAIDTVKVKNPKTGRMILAYPAFKAGRKHPAWAAAKAALKIK